MDKLNEYLQTLLSTCSYELHLEPNQTPYVVSDTGKTEVANTPLLGTQISMLIFPLIPPTVKQQLPNRPEIEFVHNHQLGNFNFLVKKSAAGFNVTIRPMLVETVKESNDYNAAAIEDFAGEEKTDEPKPSYKSLPTLVSSFSNTLETNEDLPAAKPPNFSFEESPNLFRTNDSAPVAAENFQLENQPNATEAEIEILPIDDSEILTEISENPMDELPPVAREFTGSTEQITAPQSFQPNQFIEQNPAVSLQMTAPDSANINPQNSRRIDALFYKMAEVGASDLHLSVSMPPMIRKDGKMMPLESNEPMLTPEAIKELLTSIMPAKNQDEFHRRHDTDFAYEIAGLARFRANIFMDRKGMGGVFRIIPTKILTAEELGLSKAIMDLCNLSKGLVVVTGPTGSGKSTTLCAMVDSINKNREDHIITIEDPIEFTHENQKCLVNQREVHNHTDSFKDALRAALREDPDILLVGEMRDLETISIAIETAETGHLVFGTLHTTTAASTVDRIIDQFPADRQQQVRVMLSESLRGVIAQTLLPKVGGGRIA
ncbi:MAG: PilT/PilU family type 4a pilus ATPase, partial [Pyrinomonadaceae bacterium]